MEKNNKRVKLACYTVNISMSVVGNLSPLLFLTFRSQYGLSYSLLGLLVLINFCTQLIVDLVFSFFSHRFNITKTVKFTPILTIIGLFVYSIWTLIFPDNVYIGLVIGTIIFSAASGLCEVLISAVIAAIPAKDPDREMSKLHSVYAWGVVFVIIVSTLFILLFGTHNWQYLVFIFMLIPVSSVILYSGTKIPDMETPERVFGVLQLLKNKRIWLCFTAIFLGGASECTMAQWASGYLEKALNIPKVWGDILGVALFSVMLGIGRTLYSKIGKHIARVLFFGAIGATLCYFLAAVSPIPAIGLIACAFTGFCVSMMWPGSLIIASDLFPKGGVFIYALMAAGGDLGASVAPQLIGIIADASLKIPKFTALAESFGITAEQFGLKAGMLFGMLFPLVGIAVYLYIWRSKSK